MSQFSAREIAFLSESRPILERRGKITLRVGEFPPIADLAGIGMPTELADKIYSQRARKLGHLFTEFRANPTGKRKASHETATATLEKEISNQKLF